MSAFATVEDYITWTGKTSLSDAQQDQITMKLEGVSALIRVKLPSGYDPDPVVSRTIVLAIIERAMTNTGGLRSKQVGGVAYTFGEDGGLYITDDEWENLLSGWDEGSSGAYTLGVRDEAFPPFNQRAFDRYAYRDRRELYGRW